MSVRIWKVDRERVWAGLERWLKEVIEPAPEVQEVWLFGSYARGEEWPGSDVDLLVVVREAHAPFTERALRYTPLRSGLSLEIFVYTEEEARDLAQQPGSIVWIAMREGRKIWARS
ncbi:MAG TPA: nucleotidyltransferase domain-containing protein [Thermoflexus sp.]|nr:nucleotidyltransferase domain-containing protein [Thermoflexus sp.]